MAVSAELASAASLMIFPGLSKGASMINAGVAGVTGLSALEIRPSHGPISAGQGLLTEASVSDDMPCSVEVCDE